jgi:hypothetical protein
VHRQKTQARWRRRNPGYAIAYRIDQRAAQTETPAVLRVPAPLNQLPWEFAKDAGIAVNHGFTFADELCNVKRQP